MPLYHVALERDRLDAAPKLRVLQNVTGLQCLQRYTRVAAGKMAQGDEHNGAALSGTVKRRHRN
jgi:hypothetical protein